jgi:hypothetical protein
VFIAGGLKSFILQVLISRGLVRESLLTVKLTGLTARARKMEDKFHRIRKSGSWKFGRPSRVKFFARSNKAATPPQI